MSGFSFSFGGSSSSSGSAGFSFGSSSSSGGGGFSFGSSSSSSSSGFSFGGSSGFSFGGSGGGGGGGFSFGGQNQQQQQGAMQGPAEAFQYLFEQVMPQSPVYRFRTIFYNKMEPGKTLVDYRLPAHTPAALMRQAIDGNPEPQRLVPVLCEGVHGLRERVLVQQAALGKQASLLAESKGALDKFQTRHTAEILPKLEGAKRRFEQGRARLLRAMVQLERVRAQGYAVQDREQELRSRLDKLLSDLQQPNEYRARLAELQTRTLALAPPLPETTMSGGGGQARPLLERDDLERVVQTLEEQRKAHGALVQVLLDETKHSDRLLRALASTGTAGSGSGYS